MTAEEIAARKARIADLRDKFLSYDHENYENNQLLAQKRGLMFEKLVREVFRAWGMLRRGSYHTGDNRSEQIDGVVEFAGRHSLLEAKWEKANLAASELFSFLGKVEGKFLGTIGLFVSRNPLTSNFLTALRAGRRQCIIVMHGRDVDSLFDPEFDLKGYLAAHVFHVCVSNMCHLSTDKHLKKLREEQAKLEAEAEAPAVVDPIDAKIMECLKDEAAGNLVDEFAEDLLPAQRLTAARRILDKYADLISEGGRDSSWRGENLEGFLKELVKLFPDNWTPADQAYFMEKLSRDFKNPHFREMAEFFAPRYEHIPEAEKKKFEERLVKQWDKIIGNWVEENQMSEATEALWDDLDESTQTRLIRHFVDFITSSRQSNHRQHQLARKILKLDDSKPAIKTAVRVLARDAAKSWFDSDPEYLDEEGVKRVKKSVVSALAKVKPYLDDYEPAARGAVSTLVEELQEADDE